MKWDEWRGSLDGRPVFYMKHLCCWFGCHIDLHKMIRSDDEDCFHTHPAFALRFIIFGGYIEQLEGDARVAWKPGMFGLVKPSLCHRIDALLNARVPYSLWIRFRKLDDVKLRGQGWKKQPCVSTGGTSWRGSIS